MTDEHAIMKNLKAGIAAYKAGNRTEAWLRLQAALRDDPDNIYVLLWLAFLAESFEKRVFFFNRILEIDPDNSRAKQGLEWAKRQSNAGNQLVENIGSAPTAPMQVMPPRPKTALKNPLHTEKGTDELRETIETDELQKNAKKGIIAQRARRRFRPLIALLIFGFAAITMVAAAWMLLGNQISLAALRPTDTAVTKMAFVTVDPSRTPTASPSPTTVPPTVTNTATATPAPPTETPLPTSTSPPPTFTPIPPTATAIIIVLPTATPLPPVPTFTNTPVPPAPPTATANLLPPTATPIQPTATPALPTATPVSGLIHQPSYPGERWIEVDLSEQSLTAWEGFIPVMNFIVSTGLPGTPTVVGNFYIYQKLVSTRMVGPGYDLPNVPHTMYFYGGYALHGTYWHNNFGHPMSHGCVNLSLPDAEKLFYWAYPVLPDGAWVVNASADNPGSLVVVHY